jgi:hypothetical protein
MCVWHIPVAVHTQKPLFVPLGCAIILQMNDLTVVTCWHPSVVKTSVHCHKNVQGIQGSLHELRSAEVRLAGVSVIFVGTKTVLGCMDAALRYK